MERKGQIIIAVQLKMIMWKLMKSLKEPMTV